MGHAVSRARSLDKLWFQFGHLVPGLGAEFIFKAFLHAGLIEPVFPDKYRETKIMRSIPKTQFEAHIKELLHAYASRQGVL